MSDLLDAVHEGRMVRLKKRGIDASPPALLATEGMDYWARWLRDRVKHKWDALIAVTGREGSGKSTLVLQLAAKVDPSFNLTRVCYTAQDVLARFRDTARGGAIDFDEGARALLGTDTFAKEQRALVKALMLVREKGIVTFVCVPRIFEFAKSMRSRRAILWIHVRERGHAIVHEREDRLRYREDGDDLGFYVSEIAPEVEWSPFPKNSRVWKGYVALKTSKLEEFLQETEESLGRPKAQSNAERQRNYRQRKKRKEAP